MQQGKLRFLPRALAIKHSIASSRERILFET